MCHFILIHEVHGLCQFLIDWMKGNPRFSSSSTLNYKINDFHIISNVPFHAGSTRSINKPTSDWFWKRRSEKFNPIFTWPQKSMSSVCLQNPLSSLRANCFKWCRLPWIYVFLWCKNGEKMNSYIDFYFTKNKQGKIIYVFSDVRN